MDVSEINDQTNIIAIVEILGVKCSSRNFQIEMECKQMMVIKPEKIFEKCVISLGQKAERSGNELQDCVETETEPPTMKCITTDSEPSVGIAETYVSSKKELAIVPATHYHTVSQNTSSNATATNSLVVSYLGEDGGAEGGPKCDSTCSDLAFQFITTQGSGFMFKQLCIRSKRIDIGNTKYVSFMMTLNPNARYMVGQCHSTGRI